MNSWASLSEQCDTAAKRCPWCAKYGHTMPDCPSYLVWSVERQIKQYRLEHGTGPKPPKWGWLSGLILLASFFGLVYWIVR